MSSTSVKKDYQERIVPALTEKFSYTTPMQVPKLKKIVINQGLGAATQDKKLIETAINELTAITGQKAVATLSRKDISNFKLRGNYTLGITEQIIFPEINIDAINKLMGMNITFVTSANTDEEGYALLKEFGLPFKNAKN